MKFDEEGRELPDPTPIEIPVGRMRPESLTDIVRRLVVEGLSVQASKDGFETVDEANDFDIPDEDPEVRLTAGQEFALLQEEYPGLREQAEPAVKRLEAAKEAAAKEAAAKEKPPA